MKPIIGLLVLWLGAAAAVAAPWPAPTTAARTPEAPPPLRQPWEPIEFFYRQIDLERQNVGLNGRKNATRDAAQQAEWPSVQSWSERPLSDW